MTASGAWVSKFTDRGVSVSTKKNITEQKLSVAATGDAKQGKTHFWCSFPRPIVCLYTDTNTQTADGFISDAGEGDITMLRMPSVGNTEKTASDDWSFYSTQFVPAVQNREIEAETIVVDSYSALADTLVRHIKGGGEMTIPAWGRVLSTHQDRMYALLSATQHVEGKRNYNIVVTCHLDADTGKSDVILKYFPAIQGAFKKKFNGMFGSVFIMRSEATKETVNDRMVSTGVDHFMLTVPPSDMYNCGDGVGGKAGKAALPPRLENTYEALVKAWGKV